MLVAFFFCPSADVFCTVGPIAQPVHLCAFDQEQFLVSSPILRKDRERVRADDSVCMIGTMWSH